MSDELKACPFCGEEDCLQFDQHGDVYVSCLDKFNGNNWNTRPIEDALLKRAERAERMVERLIEAGNELDIPPDDFSEEQKEWREIVAEWRNKDE